MVRILVNQIGYDSDDTKQAVLQITDTRHPSGEFHIIEELSESVVFRGALKKADPVARWNKGDFYTMDFSSFSPDRKNNHGRNYIIRVPLKNGDLISSSPIEIYGNVLEYKTLSSVMYYFKSQRVTGEYEKIDRNIAFLGGREGRVDMHGGWNDATGDIGVHLTHHSKSGYFNAQQGNLAVFVFYKFYDLIEESRWDYHAIFKRRVIDEASYGADWLMRRRAPSGSFYKTGPLRLPDAYELPDVTRKCGFEQRDDQEKPADERYEASLRSGGGYAVASLAMASRYPYPASEYSAMEYLAAAKESFLHLEAYNSRYTPDGKWNIMDEYSALEATIELYKSDREFGWLMRARKYANAVMSHYVAINSSEGYLSHDDTKRPFFSPAEEGAPILALLHYREIEKDEDRRRKVFDMATSLMRHLITTTDKVSNPFGYVREFWQNSRGERGESFFFPHDSDDAPWWQGENARILSIAAAARKLSSITDDEFFKVRLEKLADDQVSWVLGLNPFDSCMMIGKGRHNPDYYFRHKYDFIGVPSGIVNGITSAIDDAMGIEFVATPEDNPDVDDNWRWAEEWLPHAIWYVYALALKRR